MARIIEKNEKEIKKEENIKPITMGSDQEVIDSEGKTWMLEKGDKVQIKEYEDATEHTVVYPFMQDVVAGKTLILSFKGGGRFSGIIAGTARDREYIVFYIHDVYHYFRFKYNDLISDIEGHRLVFKYHDIEGAVLLH